MAQGGGESVRPTGGWADACIAPLHTPVTSHTSAVVASSLPLGRKSGHALMTFAIASAAIFPGFEYFLRNISRYDRTVVRDKESCSISWIF